MKRQFPRHKITLAEAERIMWHVLEFLKSEYPETGLSDIIYLKIAQIQETPRTAVRP